MRISDWSSDVCSSDLIRVRAVYDTEETKYTGVMNRLIAEKNNPQCDVFWSGDQVRNGVLLSNGITEPYPTKQTLLIPEHFRSKDRPIGKESVITCRSGWSTNINKKKIKKYSTR